MILCFDVIDVVFYWQEINRLCDKNSVLLCNKYSEFDPFMFDGNDNFLISSFETHMYYTLIVFRKKTVFDMQTVHKSEIPIR